MRMVTGGIKASKKRKYTEPEAASQSTNYVTFISRRSSRCSSNRTSACNRYYWCIK